MKRTSRMIKTVLRGLVLFAVVLCLSLVGAGRAAAVTINPGDLLVADLGSKGVIRVDPVTGAQTLVSSGGFFVSPIGLAIEASGSLVVVDNAAFGTGAVIRVDPVSGTQTLVSSGGFLANPQGGIALNASGHILVTTPGAFRGVIRVNPTTGVQTPVSTGGLFVLPNGLAIEASGTLLVVDQHATGAGAVIRVDPVFGTQTLVSSGGGFGCPFGLAIEATGNILVTTSPACSGAGRAVVRVNPVTGAQSVLSSGGFFVDPSGLAVEASGNILVADTNAQKIIRVDPTTGAQTLVSSGGNFGLPAGIAIASATVTEDSDGDGIPDNQDDCPHSNLSATVVIDGCNSGVSNTLFASGCTISDLIAECAKGASNHGQFASCVSHLTNDLKKAGTITGQQKGAIQSCAAKAHIP